MGVSSAGEAIILTAYTTGRYISLHTADPGNTGASEVSGGGYARQAATFAASGGNPTTHSNSALIQFPIASAGWGTVTHFGIWSAASGGTFLGGAALAASKVINTDDIARFPIGDLTVTSD